MNRWLCCGIVVLIAGCSGGTSPEQQTLFADAEAAFAEAENVDDYLRVAGTYQRLLDDGVHSPAVLCNQGNAFMRAEQPGRAIACYRQALRLTPANGAIRTNLNNALLKTEGINPPTDWFRRFVFWHDWVGYRGKFWLATFCVLLAGGVLVSGRWLRSRFVQRVGLCLSVFAIVCIASAVYDWRRFSQPAGVVIQDNTTARTGNGESYEAAFETPLREGVELRVLETRGDWLRVQPHSRGECWLRSNAVLVY